MMCGGGCCSDSSKNMFMPILNREKVGVEKVIAERENGGGGGRVVCMVSHPIGKKEGFNS